MRFKSNHILKIIIPAAAALILTGCGNENEPEAETVTPVPEPVKRLTATLSKDEVVQLYSLYPELEYIDFENSSCYEEIADYCSAHPNVEAHYSIPLCGVNVSNTDEHFEPNSESVSAKELCDNLRYLPALKSIYFSKTSLTADEISALEAAVPDISIDYSVMLLGEEYRRNSATSLDLIDVPDNEFENIVNGIRLIDSLEEVTLMDEKGNHTLSVEALGTLQQARPDVLFRYSFNLFGKTVTTADESVEFVNYTYIGDKGLDRFREVLPYLTRCRYLKLDRCGTSNEAMAALRDEFPDIKTVWRITFGESRYNTLTDAQMLRCCGGIRKSDAAVLKYCTEVEYIDFGHNGQMSDISFVEFMPKLKVLIMVDCNTPTLEPLAKCKELRLLEIVNCWNLKTIEPLSECTSLEYLNMSNCLNVKGLSPLYNLPLKRLFLGVNKFTDEEKAELVSKLPEDCIITLSKPMISTRVSYNYSIGWRLEDDGRTRTQWYVNLRKLFRYDENYYSFGKDGIANGTLDG